MFSRSSFEKRKHGTGTKARVVLFPSPLLTTIENHTETTEVTASLQKGKDKKKTQLTSDSLQRAT